MSVGPGRVGTDAGQWGVADACKAAWPRGWEGVPLGLVYVCPVAAHTPTTRHLMHLEHNSAATVATFHTCGALLRCVDRPYATGTFI